MQFWFTVEKWEVGFEVVSKDEWKSGIFKVVSRDLFKAGEVDAAFDRIAELKEESGYRFTLEDSEDPQRFKLVVESGRGGGWAKVCGLMTGQRG
jgi:hypothetical protein